MELSKNMSVVKDVLESSSTSMNGKRIRIELCTSKTVKMILMYNNVIVYKTVQPANTIIGL